MRLLHTTTLQFKEVLDLRHLRYAILSHRWGTAEVSHEDFLLTQHSEDLLSRREALHVSEVKRRQGFAKIRRFCDLAHQDGYQYCWIDTCCIDKRSSAELTEAINSMWTWYAKSAMCFVYLVDVPASTSAKVMDSALRNSDWFRRCWTLQELIAPEHLTFLDTAWRPFLELEKPNVDYIPGNETKCKYMYTVANPDKLRPLSALATASLMPETSLLNGKSAVRYACVAQKMSWAARRQATRPEDVAYSLLGIFGINMPLLYGEGDRAFMRLQHEIIRQMSDESIFAWRFLSCNGTGRRCFAQTERLLPSHPWSFTDSGNIRRLRIDDNERRNFDAPGSFVEREVPMQLTNRGLLMTIAPKIITKQDDSGVWLNWVIVPLMCYDTSNGVKRQCEIVLKLCDILTSEGLTPDAGGISVYSRVAACSLTAHRDHLPPDMEVADLDEAEQLEQSLRIFASVGLPGEPGLEREQ